MIKHFVSFKLKDFGSKEANLEKVKFLKTLFESLKSKIKQIGFYEVGINITESPSSFDLIINSEFDSLDDLRKYQQHAEHQKVVEINRDISASKVVVDYEVEGSRELPVAIFNGVVATCNGVFKVRDISAAEAKELLHNQPFMSAIGHEATAELMSELFEVEIKHNRIQFSQQLGQKAIIFKLNTRPPEGVVYEREQLEQIGYSFKLLERIE